MKKFRLFVSYFALNLIFISLSATDFSSGKLSYSIVSNSLQIVTVTGPGSLFASGDSLIIPATVTYNGVDYNVKSVAAQAFMFNSDVTNLIIESGVETLEANAFMSCSNLNSITFPDKMTTIGETAFNDCSSLVSVVLPTSLDTLQWGAFWDCTSLENIILPSDLKILNRYMLAGCSSLKEIVVPNEVTFIDKNAFLDCDSLKKVTLGSSLDSIAASAFSGCTNIKEIISLNSTPPTCDDTTFNNITDCSLIVLESDLSTYNSTSPWNKFSDIEKLDVTSINKVETNNEVIFSYNGRIEIIGFDKEPVNIYSVYGQLLYSGYDKSIALPNGVYIVKIAGKTQKILIY